MKILRAKSAGFCMGVSLALRELDRALSLRDRGSAPLKTLGPIIHNPQVLQDYASKGVVVIDNPADAHAGELLLIRAHGIPRAVEQTLLSAGVNIIDATCPKVKKAQLAIAEATDKGGVLLLFGEACHPEVLGLLSYASPEAKVFSCKAELLDFLDSPSFDPSVNYFFAAQTTQEQAGFEEMGKLLQTRLRHDIPLLSTICEATRSRQEETLDIARQVELMLVLGGKNSANTRRLAMVSESAGIKTYHVETAAELLADKNLLAELQKVDTIGLTAGASTPINLVDELQKRIESIIVRI